MTQTVQMTGTVRSPPSASGQEIAELPAAVTCLEIRADLVGDLDPAWLRQRFGGRLQYTLRSRGSRGEALDEPARRERLRRAATQFDEVELELEGDLALLAQVPREKLVLASYQAPAEAAALRDRAAALRAHPALRRRLVYQANTSGEELAVLQLGPQMQDVDLLAEGPTAFWTRIARAFAGAAVVTADLANAGEQPTIGQILLDYGFPVLRPVQRLFGIVGDPVFQAFSPRLHNAASAELGLPALYVPFAVPDLPLFWRNVVDSSIFERLGWTLDGLTTASPHKEMARRLADSCATRAERVDAANILLRGSSGWYADTTDAVAVVELLRDRAIGLGGRRTAVIGCGGTGRAVAHALGSHGAIVTLVNRGSARGERAAALLDLPFVPLENFSAKGYDLVVNATPLGRSRDRLPCEPRELSAGAAVVDFPYDGHSTAFVGAARAAGLTVIDGLEVLVTQVRRQYLMMTDATMPLDRARVLVGLAPSEAGPSTAPARLQSDKSWVEGR
jgi:3-dehydroquinate dehydratase/shikimate dehydrogenase